MSPDQDEFEADGGPTFCNYDTEIIYDADGEQHVVMLDAEECS